MNLYNLRTNKLILKMFENLYLDQVARLIQNP